MNSENNKITKEPKGFRIRSKKFFFTYPKVIDLPDLEQLFLKAMQSIFGILKRKEMKYIIAKELHEDGSPHIHIYLEFKDKQSIYSRDKLHVRLRDKNGKDIVQEGKYEAVRSSGAVIEYVLKDLDESYITNMSLPIVNGILYGSPEEHLLAVLKKEGYEAATNVLSTQYESLFARKASTIVRNLQVANKIISKQVSKKNIETRCIEDFEMPKNILD